MNDAEIAKLISFAAARANEEGVEVRVEISQPGTDQERVDIFAAPHKDARASVKVAPACDGPYYDGKPGVQMSPDAGEARPSTRSSYSSPGEQVMVPMQVLSRTTHLDRSATLVVQSKSECGAMIEMTVEEQDVVRHT